MNRFYELDCSTGFWVEPNDVLVGQKAIRITYTNSDYELIQYCGQIHCTSYKGKIRLYGGRDSFDEYEFDWLLYLYIE